MTEWCIVRVAATVGAIAAAVAEAAMRGNIKCRGELIRDQLPSVVELLRFLRFRERKALR